MATIKDVAALSGVSVTTVSRVLNKRGYISEDTYKKVYDAMAELNYQPNQLARSLSKQKTNFIGLLVPDVSHPFFAEMTHLLEISLFNHGYKLILCNTQRNDMRGTKLSGYASTEQSRWSNCSYSLSPDF